MIHILFWLSGDDRRITVKLLAIGIDDDSRPFLRYVSRKGRFASSRRTCDDQNFMHELVVTIIGDPQQLALRKEEVDSVVDALEQNGAYITGVNWLAEGEACDIFFRSLPLDETRELLAALLEHVPFDFIAQPMQGRRKKLLISDMDSTIIEQECIDELAAFAGLKEKVAAITERAMNGELDFKAALTERVALLANLKEDVLEETYKKITLMPGAKTLVSTMKANGAYCVLVSGGFQFFTSRIRDRVGFDLDESNKLEVKDGQLTGNVILPILDKQSKRDALSYYTEKQDISLDLTLAVGDGANDLPMLQLAGLGVAYRAKPAVRAQTAAKIDHCDLHALLYAQGYARREFVTR